MAPGKYECGWRNLTEAIVQRIILHLKNKGDGENANDDSEGLKSEMRKKNIAVVITQRIFIAQHGYS